MRYKIIIFIQTESFKNKNYISINNNYKIQIKYEKKGKKIIANRSILYSDLILTLIISIISKLNCKVTGGITDCYSSCKNCASYGNANEHKCIECNSGFNYQMIVGSYINCLESCQYYHYINNGIQYCTNTFQCPIGYDKLIEEKKECVSNCPQDGVYRYEINNTCYNYAQIIESTDILFITFTKNTEYFYNPICDKDSPFEITYSKECVKNCPIKNIIDSTCKLVFQVNDTQEEEQIDQTILANNIMLKNVEIDLTSIDFDTTNIEKGNDALIQYDKMLITITTIQNQRNQMNNSNVSSIDIKECENILRDIYSIPDDKTLFMKKIDVESEMRIPKIEFDIYYRLNDTNLIKLDISYCDNVKIDISIPVLINESFGKINASSEYYNDKCNTTTSDDGTDIILNDRRNNFVENNLTVCQEKCFFSNYDSDTQKAICKCDIIKSSSSFVDIKIDNKKLYENFVNIKNIANINILACYKVLFSKKGLIKNYGFFSLFPIIIIHFVLIILFLAKHSYGDIKEKIKDIKYGIKKWYLVNDVEKKKEENKIAIRKDRTKKKRGNKILVQKNNDSNNSKKIIKFGSKSNPTKKNKRIITLNSNKKNNKNKKEKNENSSHKKETNNNSKLISKLKKNKIIKKVKEIMAYNDSELNDLKYEIALQYDKRNYSQYYISLLKTKHSFISIFFNSTDYNSKIIKLDLFLVNFVLYFTINALFFNDNTMHKIFEDKGDYNFIYQIPQILYSSIISVVLGMILKKAALSEALILRFKKDKTNKNLNKREKSLYDKLKIKFILYFSISSIFLLIFWYYISMFCAIYINTQIHLIKDTIVSFTLSLIYPFGINLIPGILRIPFLSNHKNQKQCLYSFSKIIQMF